MSETTKKAMSQADFLKMLLSVVNFNVMSSAFSYLKEGVRHLSFSFEIEMPEELYQVCLDLALQNMIRQQEGVQALAEAFIAAVEGAEQHE